MPYSAEEIWFARICIVIGVKQWVDAALHLATLVKAESGLGLTTLNLPESVVAVYAIGSAILGWYLVRGGGAIARLAFKRAVPLTQMFDASSFPTGSSFVALIIRTFGALQFVEGVSALTRYITYAFEFRKVKVGLEPSPIVVELAWTIEHFIIAGTLLVFGGIIGSLFVRTKSA